MKIKKSEKIWFLRGILVACAAVGHYLTYDQLRRLMRVSDQQLGQYLKEAKGKTVFGEPDISSMIIKTLGRPGYGWGDISVWASAFEEACQYWHDRMTMDNSNFTEKYRNLPSFPGLSEDEVVPGPKPVLIEALQIVIGADTLLKSEIIEALRARDWLPKGVLWDFIREVIDSNPHIFEITNTDETLKTEATKYSLFSNNPYASGKNHDGPRKGYSHEIEVTAATE
jgi:hypothetical protein